MIKKFSYFLYKLIFLIDAFFKLITKKSFFIWFKDFIQNDSYKSIIILERKIKFFVPNQLTENRVKTFFTKESSSSASISCNSSLVFLISFLSF